MNNPFPISSALHAPVRQSADDTLLEHCDQMQIDTIAIASHAVMKQAS
jgi:hypothetical protein